MIKKLFVKASANTAAKEKWFIFTCLLAGTIVRFYFGYKTQIWNAAYDQLVWTYTLDNARTEGLHFSQLIQYPYEAGTVPISLFTLLIWSVQNMMPALSLSALVLDFFIRWFQVFLTSRIFTNVPARWLAIWSVFAAPLLLPWGMAFFGLQSVIGAFPFIYLALCSDKFKLRQFPLLVGACFALMIMFSYTAFILLLAFLVSAILKWHRYSIKQWAYFATSLLLLLLGHLWFRTHINHGFGLEPFSFFSGLANLWANTSFGEGLIHFVLVWISVLPDALILDVGQPFLQDLMHWLFIAFAIISAGLVIRHFSSKNSSLNQAILLSSLVVLLYSYSNFYSQGAIKPNFYLYRHLTCIVPFLVAIFFYLFCTFNGFTKFLVFLFILCCTGFSILYVQQFKKQTEPSHAVAGWMLSQKFGDEPKRLANIAKHCSEEKAHELYYGYGWGITAIVLKNSHSGDTVKIKKVSASFAAFELSRQAVMREGLKFAFTAGVTPTLNPNLLPLLENELDSNAYLHQP